MVYFRFLMYALVEFGRTFLKGNHPFSLSGAILLGKEWKAANNVVQ